jgi:hypothetical protein
MNKKDKARARELLKKMEQTKGNMSQEANLELGRLAFNALSEVVKGNIFLEPIKAGTEGVVSGYEMLRLEAERFIADFTKYGDAVPIAGHVINLKAALALFEPTPAPTAENLSEE